MFKLKYFIVITIVAILINFTLFEISYSKIVEDYPKSITELTGVQEDLKTLNSSIKKLEIENLKLQEKLQINLESINDYKIENTQTKELLVKNVSSIQNDLKTNNQSIKMILNKKHQFELEINPKQKKTIFEWFIYYYKILSSLIIAVVIYFLTKPLVKTKLTENHAIRIMDQIQDSNYKTQISNQITIDKYSKLWDETNNPVSKVMFQAIVDDLKDAYNNSYLASNEVKSLMFYLISTMKTIVNKFDKNKETVGTRSLYSFIVNILMRVNYYTSHVVTVPKSLKTIKTSIVHNIVNDYVNNSEIIRYKHIKYGEIEGGNSALFSYFTQEIRKIRCRFLMRAGFQKLNYTSVSTIALLMDHIYAPPILMSYKKTELFNINKGLNLIGFLVFEDTVDLYYSNLKDWISFVDGSFENVKQDFHDQWIENSGFDLNNSKSSEISEFETITFTFDKIKLMELYKINKKKIKKILKKSNMQAVN